MIVDAKIDKKDVAKINKAFKNISQEMPSTLSKALNNTAKEVRKELVKETKKQYKIKTSAFNREATIQKATPSILTAIIKVSGTVNELKDFSVSPAKYTIGKERPDILKAKVKKKGRFKELEVRGAKAFFVKFRSGHISIAQRVPGKKMKSNSKKELVKKLLSPSLAIIMGNEETVYGTVKGNVDEILHKNLEKQIEKVMRN